MTQGWSAFMGTLVWASVSFAAEKSRLLPDQQFQTPVGALKALNLTVKRTTLTSPRISGMLQNTTSKSWMTLRVNINPVDGRGTRFGPCQVTIDELAPGAARSFYCQLNGKVDFDSVDSRLEYVSGTYHAVYQFEMVKPSVGILRFSDEITEWTFTPVTRAVGFEVINKSDKVLKLDWNSATLVDYEGRTHKLAGSGIRYMEINALKPPSVLPPGARLDDMFTPTDNVRFATEWYVSPLFPECPDCLQWQGKLFSLFVPIDVGGTNKDYLFQFRVVSVE